MMMLMRKNTFHYIVVPPGDIEVRDSNNILWYVFKGQGAIQKARAYVKDKNEK